MPSLTPDEIQKFKQRLRQRRQQLIQEIHANRVNTDNKNFSDMTGGVRDAGDESLAAQLSDLNISSAEKQVTELRQVETAWPRRCHGAPMNGRSLPHLALRATLSRWERESRCGLRPRVHG